METFVVLVAIEVYNTTRNRCKSMKWLHSIVSIFTLCMFQLVPSILFSILNRAPIESNDEFITILLCWTIFQGPLLVGVFCAHRIGNWMTEQQHPPWVILSIGGSSLWFLGTIFATQSILYITGRPIAQSLSELAYHTMVSSVLWLIVVGFVSIEVWGMFKYDMPKHQKEHSDKGSSD